MAQCQRAIQTPWGDRQCARDANCRAGDAYFCWQHFENIERAVCAPLVEEIEALKAEIERLQNGGIDEYVKARVAEAELRARAEPQDTIVYFAHIPHLAPAHPKYGLIKIGQTVNLARRMEQLGATVIRTTDSFDESSLHKRFAHLRVEGEWFRSAPDLVRFIESLEAA